MGDKKSIGSLYLRVINIGQWMEYKKSILDKGIFCMRPHEPGGSYFLLGDKKIPNDEFVKMIPELPPRAGHENSEKSKNFIHNKKSY